MSGCVVCREYDLMGLGQYCPCVHVDGKCVNPVVEEVITVKKVLRTLRDGLGEEVSLATAIETPGPSKVQQQYKDQVDVNRIVQRMGFSGLLPVGRDAPRFGDFPTVDLVEAMNVVRSTEEAFMRLPAELRKRFGNDPGELWQWMQDPKNDAEAVRLGLFTAPVPPEGVPAPAPSV